MKALVGNHARAITWTGGACKLVNDLNAIDPWPWCAQATVLLVQLKRRDDNLMVEILVGSLMDAGVPVLPLAIAGASR